MSVSKITGMGLALIAGAAAKINNETQTNSRAPALILALVGKGPGSQALFNRSPEHLFSRFDSGEAIGKASMARGIS
jgi:hypothetical protein